MAGAALLARARWALSRHRGAAYGHSLRLIGGWARARAPFLVVGLLLALALAFRGDVAGHLLLAAAVAAVLGVLAWALLAPQHFCAVMGPRLDVVRWRRYLRDNWYPVAVACGLGRHLGDGTGSHAVPSLVGVTVTPHGIVLRVRARAGQTAEQLSSAAHALGETLGAASASSRISGPGLVDFDFTMLDLLGTPRDAAAPRSSVTGRVCLGRQDNGRPWDLTLAERHTLVVGASGSGKGSVLWGIVGNLAPAGRDGLVSLWGIDLKGGVELGMGAPLFTQVATTEAAAVTLLDHLRDVMVQRQARMYGKARSFQPSPRDPMHVLVIDEAAVLTAYAAKETITAASRLLSLLLTQGRALGIVVVAFVQDPRKETVGMRGLFTQTLALRLTSASETRMVLGEGIADLAPAHTISRTTPGTGYVITDDGDVTRVRADYWSDALIRTVARQFPAPKPEPAASPLRVVPDPAPSTTSAAPPRARKPRTPRRPRTASGGDVA